MIQIFADLVTMRQRELLSRHHTDIELISFRLIRQDYDTQTRPPAWVRPFARLRADFLRLHWRVSHYGCVSHCGDGRQVTIPPDSLRGSVEMPMQGQQEREFSGRRSEKRTASGFERASRSCPRLLFGGSSSHPPSSRTRCRRTPAWEQ